ncbi:helix-turn-helix domain-containing protein [Tenacibaculum jejuense]|uniref:Helix-turn-helix domain protein n=1 Tax=Tenacibaculum jejuense TaxID=584609 RepID=A0A238U5P5_9FLAO|nr:helix-turn-helix transcriptional regulator [Tenacibaculum jejuense]SNR14422.1 Helix-turn-helix domain protein [Tenacibaculum jejuense]
MTLGGKLKELREAKGLKQREVGYVIGLDGSFISQIELDKKSLNREHLSKLASFFKINEVELQILWLADKVFRTVQDEDIAEKSIRVVLERLSE